MKLISMPLVIAVSIFLARSLGPEKFGQYSFVMAILPIIALPVSGGMQQLITREVAYYTHLKKWGLYKGLLKASHWWVIIIATVGLLLFLTGYLVFDIIPISGKWSLLPIALFIVPFIGFAAIRVGTIKGLGMPAYAELPQQIVHPLTLLVFLYVFNTQGDINTELAICGQLFSSVVVFIIASWMFLKINPVGAKKVIPVFQLSRWKGALLPFSMVAFVSTLNGQVGIIMLGLLSSDEQVSAMQIAERAGQIVALPLALVNMVIAPYIVRAYSDGDNMVLQRLARKTAQVSFSLAFPVAMIFTMFGEQLVSIVFGKEYGAISYWALFFMVVGQLSNVYYGSVGYFLSMNGFERDTVKVKFFAFFLNVFFCVSLIPFFGAAGAAISVAISIFSWNFILHKMVVKNIKVETSAMHWKWPLAIFNKRGNIK